MMKRLNKLTIGLAVLAAMASCKKYEALSYSVDKPQTVAAQEDIDSYPALKTYINRAAHPNFKLGAGVNLSDYVNRGVMYRLANRNFDEIVAGYEMKHGAVVQANGTLALDKVKTFLATAKSAGLSVYGHTLTWHANQNATYLNSLIAPKVIPPTGGPTWDVTTSADFETADASNYEANTNAKLSFTAVGEGANNTGRALKITNDAVRTNDWDAQFFIKLPQPVKVGEQYELKMNVRSDANASFGTQAHIVPYSYKHYDFFGTINSTPTWATYTKQITITTTTEGCAAIAFNLGKTATNFYFDNITVKKYNESGGGPSLDPSVITNTDFESGVAGWAGWGNGSTRGQSAAGEGYGGTGYSYKFTNPSVTNFWSAQIAYDVQPPLENGSTYKLNFRVKASVAGTIRAEAQSTADDDVARDYCQRINEATARMNLLITDILAYGRLSHTNVPIHPVDLGAEVEKVISHSSKDIAERHGSIQVDRPLPKVIGDAPVLDQIIENLVSNALKFVPPEREPHLHIYAEEHDKNIRLCLEDNGIGIAAEDQSRIFGPFQRLHSQEEYPGTGIGLAIVQRGIEKMGGHVGVESSPGHGSRFWVELPKESR